MAPETRLHPDGAPVMLLASMRPGHDGPGNQTTPLMRIQGIISFNEAGARWPRKPVSGTAMRYGDIALQ